MNRQPPDPARLELMGRRGELTSYLLDLERLRRRYSLAAMKTATRQVEEQIQQTREMLSLVQAALAELERQA